MGLKVIIITLYYVCVIKSFTINLIPINRALKELFRRNDRFLMALNVGMSVWAEFRVFLTKY